VGVDVPETGPFAERAKAFVSTMVLGKNARMRFERRNRQGEYESRLFTDDPDLGIRDVAVELLRAGLARRTRNYDYKYGELSAAEAEAQKARRGLWDASPQ
jgi:endonuclease YncB( thermonuclease family)